MQLDESKLNQHQRQRLDLLRQYERIAADPSRPSFDGKDRRESTRREREAFEAELARAQQPPPAPVDDRDPELALAEEQLAKARKLFERKPNDSTAWANLKAAEVEVERVKAVIAAREKAELEEAMAAERAEKERVATEHAARVAVASEKQNELEREAVEHLVAACACFKKIDQLGAYGDPLLALRRIAETTQRVITTRPDLLLEFTVLQRLARGF